MYKSSLPDTFVSQINSINRWERWSVYRRLQELDIPCWCPQDGTLWIEIDSCINAILLRSTIQQFRNTRSDSIAWLERCWTFNSEQLAVNSEQLTGQR